ncbi:putative tRNA (guanine-N-7) methyltransferase, Trmb type, RNA methyltransferase bin3 [Rosa chinensis]|uniref:RNA methyltransferase n=1 Tax=Rosa chinensis TaxID=74649 RepID=A0A2P6RJQ2_ROSCH|nr:probable RNA methyltransferase At5g51130 [Rosa chinensis]PRQ46654.1 putative tRNA (guanine-N-7) methyltransferase, Trmb type, RNA methyltransferase bin3 [Rosa chinensis]
MAASENEKEKKIEQHDHHQDEQQHRNKKRKQVFPYGNYRAYYGYRLGQDTEEDPRLKVFKKEWFEGKDCLDIGCNAGIITIQIAKKFCCRSILGVDIDPDRVQDAYWHLQKLMRVKKAKKIPGNASKLKVGESANGSDCSIEGSSNEETKDSPRNCSSEETDLFDIVSFRNEDFVNSRDPPNKHYDTILCLSVTKWIHLNWGDDGLLTLFSKIWRLLRPGGILVLEPQPWKSYDKNHKVSEATRTNYQNIIFHPQLFQDILLDKIGFRTVEDITSRLSGSKSGFNRPILVFQK